jgi:hypothetical protein
MVEYTAGVAGTPVLGPASAAGDHLTIRLGGGNVRFQINGGTTFTEAIGAPIQAAGTHGLLNAAVSTTGRFDEWKFYA